jgi:hypothetical protein
MQPLDGAGSQGSFDALVADLKQEAILDGLGDGGMKRVGHPAKRANIVGIRSFVADEAVLGGSRKRLGKAMNVDRRMHQQVAQEEERKAGFPPPLVNHIDKYAMKR